MLVSPRKRLATRNAAFQLLRRTLRATDGRPPEDVASFPSDVCPKRLVRLLTAHSVLNFVAQRQDDLASLSEPLALFAVTLRANNAARNERLAQQLDHIGSALLVRSIPAVALKGAAELVDPVFPSRADRFLGDLDVLVPEEAIDEAIATLRQLGFTDHGVPYDRRQRHAPALYHDAWPTAVELHTAATVASRVDLLGSKDLFKRTRPSTCPGIAVPCPADRLCHLIVHAQIDSGRFEGRWILLRDVAEFYVLVEHDPTSLREVRKRFARAGSTEPLDAFQAAAGLILDVSFDPDGTIASSAPDPQAHRWARNVLTRLAWPEIHRLGYLSAAFADLVGRLVREPGVRRRHSAALARRDERTAFLKRHLANLRGFQ